MATLIDPGDEVFLDTSFAIALSIASDELHDQALALSFEVEAAHARMITTRGVLLEIGNALASPRWRVAAGRLLDGLEADKSVTIEPLSEQLYYDALQLYLSRPDQTWGLVDCVSFVIMRRAGIRKALTADHHFEQAGFEVLLKHE